MSFGKKHSNDALVEAALAGDLRSVQKILQEGRPDEVKAAALEVTINCAPENAVFDIVHALLSAGADVNVLSDNEFKEPMLHSAVRRRLSGVVDLLLSFGADINAKDVSNSNCLYGAVASADKPLVEKLISRGIDILSGADSVTKDGPIAYARHFGEAMKNGIFDLLAEEARKKQVPVSATFVECVSRQRGIDRTSPPGRA